MTLIQPMPSIRPATTILSQLKGVNRNKPSLPKLDRADVVNIIFFHNRINLMANSQISHNTNNS